MTSFTSTSTKWTSGGHRLLGALPRTIKSRRRLPDRRRATQRKVVRPSGRQPERESARRRSRSLHLASDITDEPNPNSKPEPSTPRQRPHTPHGDDVLYGRHALGGQRRSRRCALGPLDHDRQPTARTELQPSPAGRLDGGQTLAVERAGRSQQVYQAPQWALIVNMPRTFRTRALLAPLL